TKGALVTVNLTANTDLRTPEEFRELVIRESGGAVVRLKDVADVVLGAEDYNSEVRFSGEQAVFMGIWVLPNANSLDVMRAVRKELDLIKKELPAGMEAGIGYDSTVYIDDAIKEVVKTLAETLLIVVVVIFLFLGSLRAVLVPVAAIPLSIVGAFFLMQAAGFTINLLTLLAIVLCVGLVVDDAIVMVENIERHIAEGMRPFDAALRGARELIGAVISMTLTLAVVYTPIGLQGGLTGALFREFAFTLAGAVFVSGIVALTISPVMSAKLLKPGLESHGFAGVVSRFFDRLRDSYGRALDKFLAARPAVYAVWVVLALMCIPMFKLSPGELAPSEDQGIIFGIVDAPANATVEETARYAAAANDIFFGEPETEFSFQLTQPSSGFSGMRLKPWSERERT
ncbi:MAG: efflux RND transporter permease subunit, partial [Chthoniobacterales bacterium]